MKRNGPAQAESMGLMDIVGGDIMFAKKPKLKTMTAKIPWAAEIDQKREGERKREREFVSK